jgi:hypothetical protein
MRYFIWLLVACLIVLHQDYWQWDDPRLVFGFLPYTLLYHACLSMAAAVVWWLATKFCWPTQLDSLQVDSEQPPP